MFRRFLLNGALVLGSTFFCLVVGEIVCRIFFPDTRLRYEADQDVLAAIAPNQDGFIYLSDGSRAPRVRINELGLRGASLAEASERRVLFLGDSFTFGSGVTEDESFVSLVDEALGEEVTAVNGGHPGYGIYQMEIKFQRLSPVFASGTCRANNLGKLFITAATHDRGASGFHSTNGETQQAEVLLCSWHIRVSPVTSRLPCVLMRRIL